MSDPVSALKGATDGSGFASVSEIGPIGMITLRGDLSAKPLVKAAVAASGVTLPEKRHCATEGVQGMAWMSPDELLIMCPYTEAHDRLADLQGKLAGLHALAVNVSDARAVFRVRSPRVREVIAKIAPVDMHPDHFTPGMFRRTRLHRCLPHSGCRRPRWCRSSASAPSRSICSICCEPLRRRRRGRVYR